MSKQLQIRNSTAEFKANLLLEKNITDPELRKQHNQAANAAKYERRAKIESGICPRCGG